MDAIEAIETQFGYSTDPDRHEAVESGEAKWLQAAGPMDNYSTENTLPAVTGNYRAQALWHLGRDARTVYEASNALIKDDEKLYWVYPYCVIELALFLLTTDQNPPVNVAQALVTAYRWYEGSYRNEEGEIDPEKAEQTYDSEVGYRIVDALDKLFQKWNWPEQALRCAALKVAGAYAYMHSDSGMYEYDEYAVQLYNTYRDELVKRLRESPDDVVLDTCKQAYKDAWHGFQQGEPDYTIWLKNRDTEPGFIPGRQEVRNWPKSFDYNRVSLKIPLTGDEVMYTLDERGRSEAVSKGVRIFHPTLIRELLETALGLIGVSELLNGDESGE